jgi:hypothetical protein
MGDQMCVNTSRHPIQVENWVKRLEWVAEELKELRGQWRSSLVSSIFRELYASETILRVNQYKALEICCHVCSRKMKHFKTDLATVKIQK